MFFLRRTVKLPQRIQEYSSLRMCTAQYRYNLDS